MHNLVSGVDPVHSNTRVGDCWLLINCYWYCFRLPCKILCFEKFKALAILFYSSQNINFCVHVLGKQCKTSEMLFPGTILARNVFLIMSLFLQISFELWHNLLTTRESTLVNNHAWNKAVYRRALYRCHEICSRQVFLCLLVHVYWHIGRQVILTLTVSGIWILNFFFW